MKKHITIIDDEISICTALKLSLKSKYDVDYYTLADKAIEFIKNNRTDLVLLDLKISNCDGVKVLKAIKEIDNEIAVIIMTAYGNIRSSVEAMKAGAYTYLTKPLDFEELNIYIDEALNLKRLNNKIDYLSQEIVRSVEETEIIGQSDSMKKIFSTIEKFKDRDLCICIEGESGTGKEVIARHIHYTSIRRNELLVAVNCAAIPSELMEEEFFGHKKGSFTGAINDKKGKFEIANNGTLFLDEIGELPLNLQSKLLRVIQEKEYTPIGSNILVKIDVRIITATNKDLLKMVKEGKFRDDLYYRLNVVKIIMPPLRERVEDIPVLIDYLLDKISKKEQKYVKKFTDEALSILKSYTFPGNVRELENIIEYAVIVCDTTKIQVCDLPDYLINSQKNINTIDFNEAISLREIERQAIIRALELNDWHKKNTAKQLGISERGLRNKIVEYGI